MQQLNTSDKDLSKADVDKYNKHFQKLHKDMEIRFQDVFHLEIPG